MSGCPPGTHEYAGFPGAGSRCIHCHKLIGEVALAAKPTSCNDCGKALDPANYRIADGCPCNSKRGVNHGIVPRETCTCIICDPAQTGSARYPPLHESDAVRVYKELIAYVKHLTSCPCYKSLDHRSDCLCGAFEAVLAAHALAWPKIDRPVV